MKTKNLQYAILTASVLASAATVRANITGSIWENTGGAYADVTPSGSPNVTFSVPNGALDFDSRNNNTFLAGPAGTVGYSIGGWLATGGATISSGAGDANNTMNNTIIIMSGMVSVTSGEQFTVEQDDGLVLTIGSDTVLNNPGPNSPTSYMGTYTGASGNQFFTLEYAEIDGAPAVLDVQLPLQPVPEASTMLAGALLLLPLGASTLRVLRRNRMA